MTKITITIEVADGGSVSINSVTVPTPIETSIVPPKPMLPSKGVNVSDIVCLRFLRPVGRKNVGSCRFCQIRHGCHVRDYTYDKDGLLQDTGPVEQGTIRQNVPVKEYIIPLEV